MFITMDTSNGQTPLILMGAYTCTPYWGSASTSHQYQTCSDLSDPLAGW